MIDYQIINYILETKDLKYWIDNNITTDFFTDDKEDYRNYKKQFGFILEHYNEYSIVPDRSTFIDNFPGFEFLEIAEAKEYLKEKLIEKYTYDTIAPIINEGNRIIIEEDSRKGINYLLDQLSSIKAVQEKTKPLNLFETGKERFEEFKEKVSNPMKGYITTGFKELDDIFGGWDRKEEFALIAARTNHGKSWWILYFMTQAALTGLRVGMYSGEMSTSKVGYRMDTYLSNISNYKLNHGSADILNEYEEFTNKLSEQEHTLYISRPNDFGGSPTVDDLKRFAIDYKLDILGIDQVSLLRDKRNGRTTSERITNISIDLINLQNELSIPIIAVSQLNRGAVEEGARLENIAMSDRLGQDATTVWFIEQKKTGTTISLEKARSAKVGSKITYSWDIDKGKFLYIPTSTDALENKVIDQIRKSERRKEVDRDKKEDIF